MIDYLNPGDCLVINDTRVLPARLMGVKEDTGASIEVLLLKRKDDCTWETLVKPGKKCKVGARIVFGSESNEPDPETGLIKGKLVGEVVDIDVYKRQSRRRSIPILNSCLQRFSTARAHCLPPQQPYCSQCGRRQREQWL